MQTQGVGVAQRLEDLATVIHLEERQVAARHCGFEYQALRMATVSQHATVEGRFGPANRCFQVQIAIALGFDKVENFVNGVYAGTNTVVLNGQAIGQTRGITDWITNAGTCTVAVHRIAGYIGVQLVVIGFAEEGVVAQADAVRGPVGVDKAEVVAALVFAAVQTDADFVTGTEEVVLGNRATKNQTGILGKTHAGSDIAGGLLFDAVVDVDLVVSAWHLWGFDVDFLEVAKTFQTGLGLVDQVGRSPSAFHLAHFTAQHFVFRLGIATEVDAVNVSTLARIDHKGDGHGAVIIGLRHTVDVGEGITFVAQTAGDQLGGGGHHFTREHLTFLDQQQRADVFFRHLQLTAEFDITHGVLRALVNVDGDIHVLLVRGDGYLSRTDIHIDIAAVQVIGTQTLEVTGEFLASVLVVVTEEGQPVGGLQLEQIDQVFIGENRVTHHVDVLDSGNRTFVDIDLQSHAVARLRNHFSFDFSGVTALGDVLALQFVTHAFQGCPLENFAFGQAGLVQALEQVFAADGLVTLDLDTGNRRTFNHSNNQHIAIATQLYILEETSLEQFTGCLDQ